MEYLTDDEDMLELIDVIERQRRRKIYRRRENHFLKWNDEEFVKRFRLSKNAVRFVLKLIDRAISHPTQRNFALLSDVMLLVTVRYYATGSFLQVVGDVAGIDKSTVCRIVYKVSRAIAELRKIFIQMPVTEEEKRTISLEFYRIARFPKCIGALDCTHIKIFSPGGNEPEIYKNRKNFFSVNVEAVCDANCKFQNLVCRWPGSSHDSTIFQSSTLRAQLEIGYYGDHVLVGDSGYGIKPYLITPLGNPVSRAQQFFNESQITTRNPIERSFGVWKRRFPVLSFGIRSQLFKVEALVAATAVLHNIYRMLHEELPPIEEFEEDVINFVKNVEVLVIDEPNKRENNYVRYNLIYGYFNLM